MTKKTRKTKQVNVGCHKHDPIRVLRNKDKKRDVLGMMMVFEVDVFDAPQKELDELRAMRDKKDIHGISKWLYEHGEFMLMGDGALTYRKVYRDVTDKRTKYDGLSTWWWKAMFMLIIPCMCLGTLSQLLLLFVSIMDCDVISSILRGTLVGIDAWLVGKMINLARDFWRRNG